MSSADAVAVVLLDRRDACTPSSAAPTSAAGFWSLLAGGGERGRRAARADRLGDRPRLGGQPRLADLRPRRALDRLLVRVRGDLLDAVHPAEPRRARHRAARIRIRVPPHRASRAAAGAGRDALRAGLGPDAVLHGTVVGAIAGGRVPVGNAAGDPVTSWLNPLSLVIGALFVATGAYLAAVFLVSDARRAGAPDLERYFATRALVAAIVTGALAVVGLIVLRSEARFVFDGLKGDALPLVIVSFVRDRRARAASPQRPARSAPARGRRGRRRDLGLGRRPAPLSAARDADDRRRRSAEHDAHRSADRLRRRGRRSCCRRSRCSSRSSSAISSRRPRKPGSRPAGHLEA